MYCISIWLESYRAELYDTRVLTHHFSIKIDQFVYIFWTNPIRMLFLICAPLFAAYVSPKCVLHFLKYIHSTSRWTVIFLFSYRIFDSVHTFQHKSWYELWISWIGLHTFEFECEIELQFRWKFNGLRKKQRKHIFPCYVFIEMNYWRLLLFFFGLANSKQCPAEPMWRSAQSVKFVTGGSATSKSATFSIL